LKGPRDAEAMERSSLKWGKLNVEEVDVQTKRESSVKSNTEELVPRTGEISFLEKHQIVPIGRKKRTEFGTTG